MRKMKLDLEQLKVESLVTSDPAPGAGTVLGLAKAYPSVDGGCETQEGCGDPNETNASFCYGCPTMNMLNPDCANYTGVLACG